MATNETNELRQLLSEIRNAITRDRRIEEKHEDARVDSVKKSYAELNKELEYQQDAIKGSTYGFKKLKDDIVRLYKPLGKLEHSFEDLGKELKQTMKNAEKDQREVAQKTFDQFNKIIKGSSDATKDFNDNLAALAKGQERYMAALERAEKLSNDTPVPSKIKAEIETAERTKDNLEKQLQRARKPKDQKSLARKIEKQEELISKLEKSLEEEEKARTGYAANVLLANKELEEAVEGLVKVVGGTQSLNKIERDNLKVGKAVGDEWKKAREQLSQNKSSTITGALASHKALIDFHDAKNKSATQFLTGAAAAVVKEMLPQIVKDFKARQYYGINQSLGTEGVINNLGMSEAERATLVGKNQTLFRVMGSGNENAPFQKDLKGNSEMSRLQNNMLANFGLYGKEAAEKIAEFGTTLMTSGFKPTEDNLKNFSDNLKIASVITGEAPDVVKGFYDQLQQTGQMGVLQQALSDKTDKERMDFIQKNTTAMIAMNKNLGMSVEEMKRSNQEKFNASHAGLVASIRQGIGNTIASNNYNAFNPNDQVSDEDLAVGQMSETEQMALISTGQKTSDQIEAAKQKFQRVQAFGEQQRLAAQLDAYKGGNIAGSRAAGAGAALTAEEIAGGQNSVFAQPASSDALRQLAVRKGQNTDTVTHWWDSNLGGRTRGKDMDQVNIEDVNASADGMTTALNEAAKAVERFTTQVESLKGNPLSGPLAGLLGWAKEIFEWSLLSKYIFGKGGGAGGAAEKGIFASLREKIFGSGKGAANAASALTPEEEALEAMRTGSGVGPAAKATAAGVSEIAPAASEAAESLTTLGWLGKKLPFVGSVVAGGLTAYDALGTQTDYTQGKISENTRNKKVAGDVGGLAGMAVGAGIGQGLIPIPIVGALIGAIVGGIGANKIGDAVGGMFGEKTTKEGLVDTIMTKYARHALDWESTDKESMQLAGLVQNGTLSESDLAARGVPPDLIKKIMATANDPAQQDDMLKALDDIKDILSKAYDLDQKKSERDQYRFDSKEAADSKVRKFNKAEQDAARTIAARIPPSS